jgi:hypothetical protein
MARCMMQTDDMPTWDDAAIVRMLRLKRAQEEGNFHEVFDELFPPKDSHDHRLKPV